MGPNFNTMKLSIKDIAQALNLSKATVSWILSGQGEKKGFSAATIKRVKEYADSVGYQPNRLARGLSLGVTQVIGLIVPFIGDPFYAQLAEAVEEELSKRGYSLIVCNSRGDGDREAVLIDQLRAMQVDGIIMAPNKFSEVGVKKLLNAHFPFVLVDRYYPHLKTNYVIVNNKKACYDVVHALGEKGAHKIAFVTTDPHLYVMHHRKEGYKEALEDLGIQYDPNLELTVDRATYKVDLHRKLEQLLADNPDLDGMFLATHYLAMEAVYYFMQRGIDYRNRFHLGCFHMVDGLDFLAPEMLITKMPLLQIGAESVRILVDGIANGKNDSFENVVLENIF